MKISTALANIINEKKTHEAKMQILHQELVDAIDNTINKERSALINKFAKAFDLAPETVEKKILPKSKRQCDKQRLEEMRIMHENQAIMYKPIIIDGKKYFYQDKEGGIIIDNNDDQMTIIGCMVNGCPTLIHTEK